MKGEVKMSKFCSGILIAVMLIVSANSVFASEDANMKAQYTLSLEDAVSMAFEDNDRINANLHKQLADDISIESAYLTRKPYKKMPVNVSNNFEMYCLKEGYYIKAAEMSLRLSKLEESKIKSSISYEVTQSYYNLVLARKLVNAADNAYNLALANKTVVDEQFALGLIPRLDYDNALISVEMAKNALDSYRINEDIAQDNLKINLGIEGDCDIILTDDIECEEYISDNSKDIEKALETRYDITALKETRDLAYEYMDLSTVLTESSATYNNAYSSYLDAEYNYTSTLKLMRLSLKSSYNNIITSAQNMSVYQKQYDIRLREYEAAKIKYDLGVISNIELTKAINDLYDAQVSYANAKLTYRMAIEKYKYEITTGL